MRDFFNRDCMEGMAEYPDKFFDLAIVDPPYGIDISRQSLGDGGGLYRQPKKYKRGNWDKEQPRKDYFIELERVSVNQIIWGGNYFSVTPTPCWLVWDKNNGGSDFADCELAWSSFKSPVRKFRYTWSGFIQRKMGLNKEKKIHPTQKPIALYRWLLQNYANHGDKILDTHVGSASSLIACEIEGFDYVGFEIDKDYYEAAQKRIKQFRQQPTLWEQHKGQNACPDGAARQETLW